MKATVTGQAVPGGAGVAARSLAALRAELSARGMRSELVASGERPRLRLHYQDVASGFGDAEFDDNVIAAPDPAGRWWFFWPWVEPIAPADDVPGAAEVIAPRDGCAAGEVTWDGD